MENDILEEIKIDLGANLKEEDSAVLESIMLDVIEDALVLSNRQEKERVSQLTILKSNIKKATKAIYLQRGAEDVTTNNIGGVSNTYTDVIDQMLNDIIKQNKRLMR